MTVGVDLSAQPAGTATATLLWDGEAAEVLDVAIAVKDSDILARVQAADVVGIDCPFGWPAPFARFVAEHGARDIQAPPVPGLVWRDSLAYRATDRHVRALTGIVPLSVSTDRIGRTAMRCADLLAQIALAQGSSVDRGGAGKVAEVYPAASLKLWGLPHRAYKGAKSSSARHALVDTLQQRAPWLRLGSFAALCQDSDDALDAVVAALTARAKARHSTTRPPPEHQAAAATEGWIHLPTCPLADLPRGAASN